MKKILLSTCLVISIVIGLAVAFRSLVGILDLVGVLWMQRPVFSPPIPFSTNPLTYAADAFLWSVLAGVLLWLVPRNIWFRLCRLA